MLRNTYPWLLILLFGCSACTPRPKIAVFDAPATHSHAQAVLAVFDQEKNRCPTCRVRLFPIYEKDGTLTIESFRKGIKAGTAWADVLHFSWNLKKGKQALAPILKEFIKERQLVVAAAGVGGKDPYARINLDETIMATVPGIFLIGEVSATGILLSNYSQKLTTALPAPVGKQGSSFSAIPFTLSLAQWHLVQKKQLPKIPKPSKTWPSLEAIFK